MQNPNHIKRFDLIFALYDVGNKEHDEALSTHIGRVHQRKKTGSIATYSQDFITKYVAYAKRFEPQLTDSAVAEINEFYKHLRSTASEGTVAITPRQLEALYRLAEASAKIRLATEASIEDAQRAIKIFEEYLRRVGVDHETGQIDIDIIQSGISHSQHERMRGIVEIIRSQDLGEGARIEDVMTELEHAGISRGKAEDTIEKLKQKGVIFQPKHDRLKAT